MNNNWPDSYELPNQSSWQGRTDGGSNSRLFQIVECHDLSKGLPTVSAASKCFGIIGFACDAGVKRNQGRPGAELGPKAFREAFAKLPNHIDSPIAIYDFGNIVCHDDNLEQAQAHFAEVIALLIKNKIKPIAIGGGHEIAWAHYQGIAQTSYQQNIGIINFDAHFDLRPLDSDGKGSSGTPFLQIADARKQQGLAFDYTCIGIQKAANTASLFKTADDLGVNYILAEEIFFNQSQHCFAIVDDALNKDNNIYLTICMDVFAESIAPGVSAPQAAGLNLWQSMQILRYILKSGKVISIDIAELSPTYDINNKTARLAALLAFEVIFY